MEVITMNNNKVQNTKVEVPSTIEMNDENYLNDILETEKNMRKMLPLQKPIYGWMERKFLNSLYLVFRQLLRNFWKRNI